MKIHEEHTPSRISKRMKSGAPSQALTICFHLRFLPQFPCQKKSKGFLGVLSQGGQEALSQSVFIFEVGLMEPESKSFLIPGSISSSASPIVYRSARRTYHSFDFFYCLPVICPPDTITPCDLKVLPAGSAKTDQGSPVISLPGQAHHAPSW